MQMRPLMLFFLVASSSCGASDPIEASLFGSAIPANFDAHARALAALKENNLTAEKIPRPTTDLPIAGCGSGTTLIRTKKNPGKLFFSDTRSESSIVFFSPSPVTPFESRRIDLSNSGGPFLYLAVKGGGQVCAGYASSGRVDIDWSSSRQAEIHIDADVKKLPLVGGRSCGPGRLVLSFPAKSIFPADPNATPENCGSKYTP